MCLLLGPLSGSMLASAEAAVVIDGEDAYDYFGYSVALADADADGVLDVLVGGPLDNDDRGTAWLFALGVP